MPRDLFAKLGLIAVGFVVAGYLAFNLYSQPRAAYEQVEPVRTFLRRALAGDSAALAAEAADQPIQWVRMAIRLDSAAVREWAESRPRVSSIERNDTLWVTLRRPGSTARCSPLYPLGAGFLREGSNLQLVHLSSGCPAASRAVGHSPE
jgi:hypothetical protein